MCRLIYGVCGNIVLLHFLTATQFIMKNILKKGHAVYLKFDIEVREREREGE